MEENILDDSFKIIRYVSNNHYIWKVLTMQNNNKNNLILIDKGLGLFYKDIQVANKHVVWFYLYKIAD